MLGLQYAGQVIRHWKEHKPEMYRQLKKEGKVDHEAQKMSKLAANQVASLMEQGMQKHQAEEMVLRETVYAL